MKHLLKLCSQLSDSAELSGVNGLDFQHHHICIRRCWMHMNRCQFSDDENIHIGKMLHENSYRRDETTSRLFGLKPDRVDWKNREIHEIKKSSSCIQAAERQLIFYLCLMSAATQELWQGYITGYPKKKKQRVKLSVTNVSEALVSHKKIIEIKNLKEIPKVDKLKICSGCSNRGFCWGSV